MREPVYRVTSDDLSDYSFPLAVSLRDLRDDIHTDDEYFRALWSSVGESFTVGGGAAPQFTLTRIR